jgi:hypothetical protein
MKRAILMVCAAGLAVSMFGCADLQKQASGYLPAGGGSAQNQPQAVAVEGGQPVQFIPGTGTGRTSTQATNYQANATKEEPSFMGDLMKTATDSVKSEAGSTVRSTVRGLFSR